MKKVLIRILAIFAAAIDRRLPVLMTALVPLCAYAGFDHELPLNQNGIWARQYQTGLENGVIALEVAGSLWFGNDNELGHTFWQTVDSSAISGIGGWRTFRAKTSAFSAATPQTHSQLID
jgi:hypothetical protein